MATKHGGGHAVRVISGKYADLVGTVEEVSEDGEKYRIDIQGVKEDEPVSVNRWFPVSQLEAQQ